MLVARRDPFHPGAHDAAHAADAASSGAPRLARTMTMLQVAGSLLAIPVGLASAYSIYHANFSVETTCQSLRANIVSMIDKSVDAGTRHMLVRRDVEKFEQSCGAFDPDATAAFKALLVADKPAMRRVDAAPKEPARKTEPQPQATAKLPAATWSPAPAAEVRRDQAVSDAQWLDAVRGALQVHGVERPAVERPARQEAALPVRPLAAAPAPVIAPAAPVVAPVLPPAVSVAAPPMPQADDNHPVPPAAIPNPVEATAQPEPHHSRIGRWIARVPLLGPVWENGKF